MTDAELAHIADQILWGKLSTDEQGYLLVTCREQKEKLAALEAKVKEMVTMPGDSLVTGAIESGLNAHLCQQPGDCCDDGYPEGLTMNVLARALTATRVDLSVFTEKYKEYFQRTKVAEKRINELEAANQKLETYFKFHPMPPSHPLNNCQERIMFIEKERDSLRAKLKELEAVATAASTGDSHCNSYARSPNLKYGDKCGVCLECTLKGLEAKP